MSSGNNTEEHERLERRKHVLLKFLSIEPDTLGSLKFIIGGDGALTEKALANLVQEGKVTYMDKGVDKGMYFAKGAAVRW